jgi:hypothetical protein
MGGGGGHFNVAVDDSARYLVEKIPAKSKVLVLNFSAAQSELSAYILDAISARLVNDSDFTVVDPIEAFKAGQIDCLIANNRMISFGYNLQISHSMMFYSNDFSLEKRLQAEARIQRTGQEQKCVFTDYIYLDTIDMKIVAALKYKRDLLSYITQTNIEDFINKPDDIVQLEFNELFENYEKIL